MTLEDVSSAIAELNRRKSADVYGLTAEHLLYGGTSLLHYITDIIQAIFDVGEIPDMLKRGILSPVYKNKGSQKEATNYRGITVTPVLSKLIELLIRNKIRPKIDSSQNTMQKNVWAESMLSDGGKFLPTFANERVSKHYCCIDNNPNAIHYMITKYCLPSLLNDIVKQHWYLCLYRKRASPHTSVLRTITLVLVYTNTLR